MFKLSGFTDEAAVSIDEIFKVKAMSFEIDCRGIIRTKTR